MKFPAFIKIAVNKLIGICHLEMDFEGKYVLTDGSNAEFLQILSEALKFKYELLVPEDKEWGFKELNGTWNGLVGMVHRQEVDMAMCGIMLTEERQLVVNFGQSYDVAQNVIALKAPGLSPKPLAYVYHFFGIVDDCNIFLIQILYERSFIISDVAFKGNEYSYHIAAV
ncbi:glutamate receptor ionotropic, kainate 4 [Caerostris darwini]|uniref:Glutamate receptor ionotropic, kainate 4 n=1 Tax=Caerostris darwini TaxID=1538125 RepID=A0AAV4MWE3_9ARAC|nr:glutamate receptor ionotropic, kainate 4 [Caerostris darwini]